MSEDRKAPPERILGAFADIENFLDVVQHELLTPVQAIWGGIDLLRAGGPRPDQAGHLTTLELAAGRLQGQVRRLLDLARLDIGARPVRPSPHRLRPWLGEVWGRLAGTATARALSIDLSVAPSVPEWLDIDGERAAELCSAILTLADDSVGVHLITIRLDVEDRTETTARLVFSVRLSGDGLTSMASTRSPANAARLDGSFGIGLLICSWLARSMGGECTGGTIDASGRLVLDVSLRAGLPDGVAPEHAVRQGPWRRSWSIAPHAADHPEPVPTAMARATPPRVLLVEDDPLSRAVLRAGLETLGARVDVACDGEEALAAASLYRHALILMDLRLPRLDGFNAAQAIRERPAGEHVPIVAITADPLAKARRHPLARLFDAMLEKPLRVAQLADILALADAAGTMEKSGGPTGTGSPRLPASLCDPELVEEVVGFVGSAVFTTLLKDFTRTLPARLDEIERDMAMGPAGLAQAGRTAHSLKGAAHSLGLSVVAEAAGSLVRETEEHRVTEQDPALLGELRRLANALTRAVDALPEGHGA